MKLTQEILQDYILSAVETYQFFDIRNYDIEGTTYYNLAKAAIHLAKHKKIRLFRYENEQGIYHLAMSNEVVEIK